MSSFQLENIEGFRLLGAAVLNLMKNHLDRYSSKEDYYNAKKEIARNFTKENYLVLNANDPLEGMGSIDAGEDKCGLFRRGCSGM